MRDSTAKLITHLYCVSFVVCESQSEEVYLPECIVDKTLPPGEDGNYLDCSLEETAKDGKTDCCQLDGQTGCCKKGEK